MQNNYFDSNHPLLPYTHSLQCHPETFPPPNAKRGEKPEITKGCWPCWSDGWQQAEDHRKRAAGDIIPESAAQEATEYWLPGDTWETPARTMDDIGPLPEGALLARPGKSPEKTAQAEYHEALSEASAILTARAQRRIVQAESFSPAEFAVFAKAGLFPAWAPGAEYAAGDRVDYKGAAYEAMQPVSAQAHQPPGSDGMLAVYRPISANPASGAEPDGSRENPLAYTGGMDVFSGKYYAFEGALYHARADMLPCVWAPNTPGLWQWEIAAQGED